MGPIEDAGFASLRANDDSHFASLRANDDSHFASLRANDDAHFASLRANDDAHFASLRANDDAHFASLRANDDALFAGFVLSSQRRLRRTAYPICGDRHRAEDIVQTAFAQVYSRWARVYSTGGPEGYVHLAVVNAAIDERRRPWRRPWRATEVPPERPTRPDDGLTAELLVALAAPGRRQRAGVVLRYVEDLDVETTAHLVGVSPGTVKSQAARGLATLRPDGPRPGGGEREGRGAAESVRHRIFC